MLEKPRGCEDLSLEKQKKHRHYSARNLRSVRLSQCRDGQSYREKNPAGARTFATELCVPNMHIRTHRDFENAAHPLLVIHVGNTGKHSVCRSQSN